MNLLSLFKNSSSNNAQTLILGTDNFLNDYVADSYAREAKFADFDREIVDCETDGLDEMIADLTQASLFSQSKLLVVKNPFFLTAKPAKKFQKQLEQLTTIFTNMSELNNVVVLVASYDKIDRRKKLVKTVLNQFNVVETNVKPYEVSKLIKSLIKAEGFKISSAALELLLDRSDHVVDTVLNNYRKVKMFAHNQEITTELIDQNVDVTLAQNIFAILETALAHKLDQAVARLDNQLEQGSNPIQLIAVFINQLELILTVKILAQRGRSEGQIAKGLGVHPYRVKLALKQALTVDKLTSLLARLIELDYNYKNSTCSGDNFLRLFILSV